MGMLLSRFYTEVYGDECFGPGQAGMDPQHNNTTLRLWIVIGIVLPLWPILWC
jgi:hypothetical protein